MATPTQNFGLSEDEFEHLRQKLLKGDNALIAIIFQKHIENCCNILVKQYGASHEEAYDAAAETLWQFKEYVINKKVVYGNMGHYFTTMATWWYRNGKRKDFRLSNSPSPNHKSTYDDPIGMELAWEGDDYLEREEIAQAVNMSLEKLRAECQNLLKTRYIDHKSFQEILQTMPLPLSVDALKMKIKRCADNFRHLFKQTFTPK